MAAVAEEAAKAAKKADLEAQIQAADMELRAQRVSRSRLAWGYKTAGPEPKPELELSGILAGVLFLVGPLIFFGLGAADQCAIRPNQEVCRSAGRAPQRQLSASEEQLKQVQQQAALINAVRRQCLRNAMSEEDEERCGPAVEVVVPRRKGVF